MERTITGMYYNGNIWAVSCWNRNNAVYVHGMTVNTLAACVVKSWTTMIIELSRHHEGPFGEVSIKNAIFNMKSSCYWYVVGSHMTIASNIPRFLLSIAGEVHRDVFQGDRHDPWQPPCTESVHNGWTWGTASPSHVAATSAPSRWTAENGAFWTSVCTARWRGLRRSACAARPWPHLRSCTCKYMQRGRFKGSLTVLL